MSVYTTEITSDKLQSDNPIHQRLLKAYIAAKPWIRGKLLELGCGEGRGIAQVAPLAERYTAIDKIASIVEKLRNKHPQYRFESGHFPPIPFPDNSYDTVISFQVIEHLKDDRSFIREIYRILRPGGTALLTTPNILMTLTRNPWHVREYTGPQLKDLCLQYFTNVEMKGIAGNQKIMAYYERNKTSVENITKYDVLDLQHRLPSWILRTPYDLLNRMNRNLLKKEADDLVGSIRHEDYEFTDMDDQNLDLFCILNK